MALIDDILAEALPKPLKDNFGDAATYTHKPGNTTQAVTVIISDPLPEGTYPGKNLSVEVFLADLSPAPAQGDHVTLGSTTYTVVDVKASDTLIALLSLRKHA